MTREEIIRRGESASRLLGDTTAMLALDELQKECAAAWADSGPHQQELRDDAYRMSRCAKLLKIKLETWRNEAVTENHNADPKISHLRTTAHV